MINVPAGKKLIINVNSEPVTDYDMIIEEDIAFSLSSDFNPLLSGGSTKIVDLIGGLVKERFGKGFTGQFKQMGIQIWEGTRPLSLKITVGFYIDKKHPDAFTQVYQPAIALAKLPLPTESASGNLTAPGPTLASALIGTKKGTGGKVISVEVGKILYLQSAIVKSAEPIFSNETDENNYPIWSKVSLDIISVMTATTRLLDDRAPNSREAAIQREREQ